MHSRTTVPASASQAPARLRKSHALCWRFRSGGKSSTLTPTLGIQIFEARYIKLATESQARTPRAVGAQYYDRPSPPSGAPSSARSASSSEICSNIFASVIAVSMRVGVINFDLNLVDSIRGHPRYRKTILFEHVTLPCKSIDADLPWDTKLRQDDSGGMQEVHSLESIYALTSNIKYNRAFRASTRKLLSQYKAGLLTK